MTKREAFIKVKKEINDALDEINKKSPALGEYIRKNIVFDEIKMTVKYVGDDRVAIQQILR